MGSNGLTSARRDVLPNICTKYPESFDASVPNELVYSGQTKLTDTVENSPIDAGKLVLSKARIATLQLSKILSKIQFQSNSRNGALFWWCSNKSASLRDQYSRD